MAKHLLENQKYHLSISVLNGESYASAGKKYGIAKSTARDICCAYFRKIIMPGEANLNGVAYEKGKISKKTRSELRRIWKGLGII